MKLVRILLFLTLATILTAAQNMKQTTSSSNAKFAQMTDQFVKESLALSPVSASGAGYHQHKDPRTGKMIDLDAELDDVSAQGIAVQEKFYREWRKRFQTETPVTSLNSCDNLKVIPTPEFMRGIFSVAGFHGAPPLEPTAEAQYWVTPVDPKMSEAKAESKLREYNNYALKWLTIHEALPGHYVQGEHADDVQPPTRRVLRSLFGNGAYVEGWAEYIADVMTEEGYLDFSPKFGLVRRKIFLRAVANTILDIRLQTMNMTEEQAMDLMLNATFQTQAEAEGKMRRAKLSSTQLPTYFVGWRQWWDLRKKYQAAKGSAFTLEEFHNQALDQGALPIEYLERIILPTAGN
jgi:uncharacterized protein (DUF885 family)